MDRNILSSENNKAVAFIRGGFIIFTTFNTKQLTVNYFFDKILK